MAMRRSVKETTMSIPAIRDAQGMRPQQFLHLLHPFLQQFSFFPPSALFLGIFVQANKSLTEGKLALVITESKTNHVN